MTTAQSKSSVPLRDVLYSFSLAKSVPDAELLDEYVRNYPEYGAELTDFAVEIIIDAARGDVDVEPKDIHQAISPVVSRAMSRFQNHLYSVKHGATTPPEYISAQSGLAANPFTALDRAAFRDLAARLHANTVFVAKLRDCEIDDATMTDGFKRHVAEELSVPIDIVIAHFAGGSKLQRAQFHKSENKPTVTAKQSFKEAVRDSGLSEEQQLYLVSL